MNPESGVTKPRHHASRRRLVLASAIAVVVALIIVVLAFDGPMDQAGEGVTVTAAELPSSGPVDPSTESTVPTVVPAPNSPAPRPPTSMPTQPPATGPSIADDRLADIAPLTTRIADLTRRADAGDTVASCMLGVELQQCAERRRLRNWLRLVELGPTVVTAATTAENIAAARATLARLERHCAGVPAARIDEAPRRLFDAADRGNGAAASLAVLFGEHWIYARLVTEPDLVARLRDGYPRWVDAALQAQDLEAATGIVRSAMLGHPQDLAVQALGRDGVALRALDLALVRIASETGEDYGDMPSLRLAQSEATLDADARARAEVLGQRWYEALMRFPDPDTEPDVDADADAATDIAPGELSWERLDQARVDALHERCARG
jgi:hypothetical protein